MMPVISSGGVTSKAGLLTFIASGYVFKVVVALVDTGPIYLLVGWLQPYLGLANNQEVGESDEHNTVPNHLE